MRLDSRLKLINLIDLSDLVLITSGRSADAIVDLHITVARDRPGDGKKGYGGLEVPS